MTKVAVRISGLHKQFRDVLAVNGFDLEIYEGEIFGLLGPNGAGKTTTIRVLLGLTKPSKGWVEALGLNPVKQAGQVRARTGYAMQQIAVDLYLTGRENLQIFASNALAPLDLMPPWLRWLARFNPMTYAINNVRRLILEGIDWTLLGSMSATLIAFDVAMVAICLWATRRPLD